MYLKEIGINGFKSFPDRVRLEFKNGITAVVGPNGSGKSNISDAVRWVLGEQKVKNLRGEKMEDVIFAGTDTRKAIGFAEVYITLDNSDKDIPIDFSEITVKRTVFRSGESKYTINGATCRLKDLNEIFMDTGIGREGYSIIGQGKIDEILSAKSDDRRHFFEEAAGIAKYRIRRIEAMAKLEKERENILRIEDIITEIETNIESLKKESENAKKYIDYSQKLKNCEIALFYIKAKNIDEKIKIAEKNVNLTQKDISETEEKYNNYIALLNKYKTDIEKTDEKINELNQTINQNLSEFKENNGRVELIKEQILNYEEKIKQTENDFEISKTKVDKIENDISILRAKNAAFIVKLEQLHNDLNKKETEFNNFDYILNKNEEKLNKFKSDIFEKMRMSAALKTEFENIRINIEQLKKNKNDIEKSLSIYRGKIEQENIHITTLNKKITENEENILNGKKHIEDYKYELNNISTQIFNTQKEYNQQSMKYSEMLSKQKVLTDMKNEFEGYYKSVKAVLKEGLKYSLKGIHGAVGDIIKTDEKYETAIEIALGNSIQNIVTKDEYSAKMAIEYLKRENLGRATFMPVSVIEGRRIDDESILNYEGVCGVASDIVEFEQKYINIVTNLLGRVIVAINMDCAIKIAANTGRKYRIVTLDGDVINTGGAMTGGSIKKATGIFGRSRELLKIESLCNDLKNNIYYLKNELEKLNKNKDDTNIKINNITLEIHKFEVEREALIEDIKKSELNLLELNKNLESGIGELDYIKNDVLNKQNEFSISQTKLKNAESDIENTDKEIEEFRNIVDLEKAKRDSVLSEITELKVLISSDEQEKNNVCENVLRLENELKNEKEQNNDYLKLNKEYNDALNLKKEELKNTKVLAEEFFDKKTKNEQELNEIVLNKSRISEITQNAEKDIKDTYDSISELKNIIFKYNTNIENLKNEREKLYSLAWDDYEITYHKAKEFYNEEKSRLDIEKETKNLRAIIKDIGNVNLDSIDKYAKTKERYDFLTAQRDDIKNAENNLIKVINDLEQLMKERFSEQFGIISENFNYVFGEMFGGGKAELKLSDSNNVLESGIDIIAQPPGKATQNMLLLSGGERALTAIAILFAILKMKPSPFCILDEIEAALDDANVKRFADYLKKFSNTTQFIVISHRKGTMEAADVLYGVTMQEKGISKIISLSFDDIKSEEV